MPAALSNRMATNITTRRLSLVLTAKNWRKYRKIHLFDVDTPGGTVYRESDTISRGEDVVTYQVGDTKVGCAICYDVRFPELFRKLRDEGAEVIVLPAAFTLMTGKDHWEVLARARAIETQTYFLAVGQTLLPCRGTQMVLGSFHGHRPMGPYRGAMLRWCRNSRAPNWTSATSAKCAAMSQSPATTFFKGSDHVRSQ